MKKLIIYIGLTITFLVVGLITGQFFLDISISELNMNNVRIAWITMSGQFQQNIFHAIAIGLLPFLYFISGKISRAHSQYQKLSIILIILILGFFLWQFRIYQLNLILEEFSEIDFNGGIKTVFFGEDLKLEFYLILGFIIGTLLSSLTIRQININKLKE